MILFLATDVNAYLESCGEKVPDLRVPCPRCPRSNTHRHGFFRRGVYDQGREILVPIYRRLCPDCGLSISLLPDFLTPRSAYQTPDRELAVGLCLFAGLTRRKAARLPCFTTASGVSLVSEKTVHRFLDRLTRAGKKVAALVVQQVLTYLPHVDLENLRPAGKQGHAKILWGLGGRLLELFRRDGLKIPEPGILRLLNRLLPVGTHV